MSVVKFRRTQAGPSFGCLNRYPWYQCTRVPWYPGTCTWVPSQWSEVLNEPVAHMSPRKGCRFKSYFNSYDDTR
eukprot:1037307-Rhodomonas_salina.1